MIAKETVRIIIGWFLYIPFIVIPVVAVVALLFRLRKMTKHSVSIMNLIFAGGAVLFTHLGLLIGNRWAGSPPTTAPAYIFAESFAAICWLASAGVLYFCKPRVWVASLLAQVISTLSAGAIACFFFAILVTNIRELLHPGPEVLSSGPFRAGYIFACIAIPTWISLELAISLRLVFGLLRMHKTLAPS